MVEQKFKNIKGNNEGKREGKRPSSTRSATVLETSGYCRILPLPEPLAKVRKRKKMDGRDSSIGEVLAILMLGTLVFSVCNWITVGLSLSIPSVPKNETEGKLFSHSDSLWTNHSSEDILEIQNICKDDPLEPRLIRKYRGKGDDLLKEV